MYGKPLEGGVLGIGAYFLWRIATQDYAREYTSKGRPKGFNVEPDNILSIQPVTCMCLVGYTGNKVGKVIVTKKLCTFFSSSKLQF